MIKIKLRKNLIYLLTYFISSTIRTVLTMTLEIFFSYIPFEIFLYLMILGEIIGGLSIYLYQYESIKQKKKVKYFGINLIVNQKGNRIKDGKIKIFFLIIFASYFDIFRFAYGKLHSPFVQISGNIDSKLSSIQTIASSLLCTYALRFKMKKHHKISLLIIGICLFLISLFEIIFKPDHINTTKGIFSILFTFYYFIGYSFNNCIEKYLVDTNYISPFLILLFEGLFQLFLVSFSFIRKNPFKEMINEFNIRSAGKLILFIFLLFLYSLLSLVVNIYRIYCNVIYSPMARSLIDYLLNPFFEIYYYTISVKSENETIKFIFFIILSLIIDFFGCIYNEYIILSCCGLEQETMDEIANRAKKLENLPMIKSTKSDNNKDKDADDNDNDIDDDLYSLTDDENRSSLSKDG